MAGFGVKVEDDGSLGLLDVHSQWPRKDSVMPNLELMQLSNLSRLSYWSRLPMSSLTYYCMS